MGRFVFWFVIFTVAGGLILHYNVDVPFVSFWLGKLPGDFIVQKQKSIFYFPVVSGAITSLVFSFLLSLIFKKPKK